VSNAETQIQAIDDAMNLALVGEPDQIVMRATKACTALMKIVEERKLYEDIGKARHLKVEAWLLCGHFFGVTTRVVSVVSVVDEMNGAAGFEATVEAYHLQSGRVIGNAVARCLNNEENWGDRPKYAGKGDERRQIGTVATPSFQLESMAQTRATSKVLASLFRWVVILGGATLGAKKVSGTPAEEMAGERQEQGSTAAGGKKISEGQRKRIFAIAKEVGYPYNDLPALFEKHGFKTAADVTQNEYDALIADLQHGQTQAAP
jgi:hypothetical protein